MSATTASVGTLSGSSRNKFPFTTTQWQELEHQALIYKYMAAGIPIPPDLLFSIKRSLDSSLSSKLFPFQSSPLSWNPYQMGYGKKIDPEPGRCRRTDGKKWRCSKEAYPDSKYCERHMHRGKNRSRKPVESPLTNTVTTNTNTNNNVTITSNNSPLSATTNSLNAASAAVSSTNLTNQSLLNKNLSNSLYSSYNSSDSSYNSNNNAHLLYPQNTPYNSHKDYRYYQGLKEEVGEHAFFTESSGSSMRGFPTSSMEVESWQLGEKQGGSGGGYPTYINQYDVTTSTRQQQHHHQQEKQCYIWGRDFNCELSMKVDEEEENRCNNNNNKLSEKTTHHFFDEWPIKNGGGSNGLGDDSSSTTQLSISIPTSNHHDFFLSNSRNP
ncbi:hypothetical protein RND81_08G028600 [Saponaria officinalis]|uniref:Growth-regulating factor n=1 Tax=Saponaria officinalis TaxID=3572 RepID=A0AAW1J2H3_SAPOF